MDEADHAAPSIVIPMVKKLNTDLTNLKATCIETLRDEALDKLEKYAIIQFDHLIIYNMPISSNK